MSLVCRKRNFSHFMEQLAVNVYNVFEKHLQNEFCHLQLLSNLHRKMYIFARFSAIMICPQRIAFSTTYTVDIFKMCLTFFVFGVNYPFLFNTIANFYQRCQLPPYGSENIAWNLTKTNIKCKIIQYIG